MAHEPRRQRQTTDLIACPACSEFGAITWVSEDIHALASAVKKILNLSSGFHIDETRGKSGGPAVVCDRCDVILPL